MVLLLEKTNILSFMLSIRNDQPDLNTSLVLIRCMLYIRNSLGIEVVFRCRDAGKLCKDSWASVLIKPLTLILVHCFETEQCSNRILKLGVCFESVAYA